MWLLTTTQILSAQHAIKLCLVNSFNAKVSNPVFNLLYFQIYTKNCEGQSIPIEVNGICMSPSNRLWLTGCLIIETFSRSFFANVHTHYSGEPITPGPPVAAIVGGIIGGLVAILIVAALCYLSRQVLLFTCEYHEFCLFFFY